MAQHETSPSARGPNWLSELVKNLRLAWRLLRDPAVPTWLKLIPLGALVYILMPLDFIPDWMFGLGQADDLTLFLLSLKVLVDLCPWEVVERHLAQMSSIEVPYRVVKEEQPQAPDAAGYLDVESRVLPDQTPPAEDKASDGSAE